MIQSLSGIVLHYVKYSESSIIAHVFTREMGRQSFMVNGIKGKRSQNKLSYFQGLSLLNMEAYVKQSRELHKVKEVKIDVPFQQIPFDVYKSTQALFLAEFLYKTLHEEGAHEALYEFVRQSILILDLAEEDTANFHLFFVIHLSKYFGFFPSNDQNELKPYFNLRSGKFVGNYHPEMQILGREESSCLSQVLKTSYAEMGQINLSGKMRLQLLKHCIEYYQLHFDKKIQFNSLSVLESLFYD
jgi:DNA repair protein RecO (recombination protein O)